ncbi:MAG: M24 family metallopeptidase [Thermoplasmata archaeon]
MENVDYPGRWKRCRAFMENQDIDLLALTPGPNMTYLTGFLETPGERLLTALLLRDAEPRMVVPALYAEQVKREGWIRDVRVWSDGDDQAAFLRDALSDASGLAQVALDTRMWARFVIMIRRALPGTNFQDAEELMAGLRIVKGPEEVTILREAHVATDRAMEVVVNSLQAGQAEREVANTIRNALMDAGADAASFRPIAASGPNGSQPHYRFGDRRLRRGDAVVLDFGGMFGGYYTDVTRTIFLARADKEQRTVYELVREANEQAVDAARAGTPAQDVDRTARKVIVSGGYGDRFIHRTGHGIGLEVHEEPYIVEGNDRLLEEGMAFSVEPGIYLPDRFGVRIENIVLVEKGRAQRLDRYPRDLQVIPA